MEIINRKARYEYNVLEDLVAGIVLQGSEVKSIRKGKCNISDAYCYIHNGEIFLKNAHISKYDSDKFTNHDELRDRTLLLSKKEINKWNEQLKNLGITIIPLKMFINEKGLIKILIGLCKGKKEYDKRESIKEKDSQREIDRAMKIYE